MKTHTSHTETRFVHFTPIITLAVLLALQSISSGDDITKWFSLDPDKAGNIPESIKKMEPVSLDKLESVREKVWKAYLAGAASQSLLKDLPKPPFIKKGEVPPKQSNKLNLGEKTMPFYFFGRGKIEGKRPLFIALHGGGSAGGRAPGPHSWGVNTREWNTQAMLAANRYPDKALYFVPRMADDNDGRWYFNYCQDAYDRVVRAAIAHHNVDPNRIYLIGISEGAYTAYRLGAFMADRWAGAGSMAGGEPLKNAPPENMRNVAFRADIGEFDRMFDRIGLNRRYGEALGALKKDDPDGFRYMIHVAKGRGHGLDYTPCPAWILKYSRDPFAKRVLWKAILVHQRRKEQFYWLAMDEAPRQWPVYVDARIKGQTVDVKIQKEKEGKRVDANDVSIRVYLNDKLLDLEKPVTVTCNGKQRFSGKLSRSVEVMMRSLAERGDPNYMFSAEVLIEGK